MLEHRYFHLSRDTGLRRIEQLPQSQLYCGECMGGGGFLSAVMFWRDSCVAIT